MSNDGMQNYCTFGEMIIPVLQSRDSTSPPKAQVDDASLQQAMDKNKESLKVKLMTRRPITQLVDQGIMPPLKITPQFHHQRQKLERAKMGDYLKNKIQRRPDRQALIQQHILEDTTVDPSLHDKQRQLKKARLADDLNDRLSHRPGPLELVKGNILQADEKFAQAVKEGQIQFKRTCEGQSVRHPPPSFAFEEDSGSDVTLSPPQDCLDQSLSNLPSVESMVPSPYTSQDSPVSQLELKPAVVSPIAISAPSSVSSVSSVSSQSSTFSPSESVQKESSPTVLRVRKKSKPKAQPKPRTIKFHEYKGPPSAQKNLAAALMSETSYELLLKQQQLFLQWQLEWQQKYPQMILPVPQKSPLEQNQVGNGGHCGKEQSPDLSLLTKCWSKLEDLKVSDLKAELKKRNLPVSGSKPQLIERLKPYSDFTFSTINKKAVSCDQTATPNDNKAPMPISIGGIMLDPRPTLAAKPTDSVASIVKMETTTPHVTLSDNGSLVVYNAVPMQGSIVTTSRPSSTAPMDIEVPSPASDNQDDASANDDIVKMQQKKIQELQRELQKSQLQLQHQQWLQQQQVQQQAFVASQPLPIASLPVQRIATVSPIVTSASQSNNVDTKALQTLQQHLQQKLQQQQLLQHLQQQSNSNTMFPANSAAVSAAVKANLAAFIHNNQQNANNARIAAANQQTLPQISSLQPVVLCHAGAYNNTAEKPRANSVPNGLSQQRLLWTHSMPNFSAIIAAKPVENVSAKFVTKLPPDYNEATKQLTKVKQENKTTNSGNSSKRGSRKSVKSQAVDDVLEILIKSGELPPSAAQEPATPTTPETQKSNAKSAPSFPKTITTPAVPPPPPPPPPPPVSSPPVTSTRNNITLPQNSLSSSTPMTSNRNNITLPQSSLPSSALQSAEPQLHFDFQLELQDIEAMDLGVLDAPTEDMSCDNHCDSPTAKEFSNSVDAFRPQDCNSLSSSNPTTSKSMDVDLELSDWLEVLTSSPPLDNQSGIDDTSMLYNCSGDPVMPSFSNGHSTFDMFSLDDMDFRTPSSDLNTLSWDKLDFAT